MEQARNVVGAVIRRTRNARGMSQERLTIECARLGFSLARGTLAKIESQIRGVSDIELFVLAEALKVSVVDLYPKTLKKDLRQDKIEPFHIRKT